MGAKRKANYTQPFYSNLDCNWCGVAEASLSGVHRARGGTGTKDKENCCWS